MSPNSDFRIRISEFLSRRFRAIAVDRMSIFGFRILCVALFASTALLLAAEPNGASDLPASSLKPPRGELTPTFWEQHGALIVVGILLVVILCSIGIWFLLRPKPPAPTPPATHARRQLESLRQQPEDGLLLSRTWQILHRYIAATFGLPSEEMTTSEFCHSLSRNETIGASLSEEICTFLRACDLRKFAPVPAQPPLGAVERCFAIIERVETRLAEVKRASDARSKTDQRPTRPTERAQGLA